MKRFYCTICGRVKRVRSYPQDIRTPNSNEVMDRVGTCARHYAEHDYQPVVKAKVSDLSSLLNSRTVRGKKRA